QKPGQNVARRPGWAPVFERHEDHLVAAERAPVPGAVLADDHALGKAWKRSRRQPAQAERSGVAAERIVRLDRPRDRLLVLRHAVIHRLPPVAVGPAVEAAVADRGEIVRRRLVAETVALVDHRPERARVRLPCEAHRIAQAGRKDAALAARQIEFMNRRPALFDLHALSAILVSEPTPM